MSKYKLSDMERMWVEQTEHLIREFSEGLNPEAQDDWYLECAELLCDLAHNYYIECKTHRTTPIFEEYYDRVLWVLAAKLLYEDQLSEAFDLFRCGGADKNE